MAHETKNKKAGFPSMAALVSHAVAVRPRWHGRSNTYERHGLFGRLVSEGVYRFKREDGRKLDLVSATVKFAAPECDDEVRSLVKICKVHDLLCPGDRDDCKTRSKVLKVKRWVALIQQRDLHTLDVHVLARPNVANPRIHDTTPRPRSGAGFFLLMLSTA